MKTQNNPVKSSQTLSTQFSLDPHAIDQDCQTNNTFLPENPPNIISHDGNIEKDSNELALDPENPVLLPYNTQMLGQVLSANQDQQLSSISQKNSPLNFSDNNSLLSLGSKLTKRLSVGLHASSNSSKSCSGIIMQTSLKSQKISASNHDSNTMICPLSKIGTFSARSHYSQHQKTLYSSHKSSNQSINKSFSTQSQLNQPVQLYRLNFVQIYFTDQECQQTSSQKLEENLCQESLMDENTRSCFSSENSDFLDQFQVSSRNYVKKNVKIGSGSTVLPLELKKNEHLLIDDQKINTISKIEAMKEIIDLNNKSLLAMKKFQYNQALGYIRQCIDLNKIYEIHNFEAQPILLNNLGLILFLQGDLNQSKEIIEKCLEIKRKNKQIKRQSIVRSLILLGSIERERKDFDAALLHLNDAAQILNSKYHFSENPMFQLFSENFSIPNLQQVIENPLQYPLASGQKICPTETNAKDLFIKTLNSIALVHFSQGNLEKAVFFLLRVFTLICQKPQIKFNIKDIYEDVLHMMKEDFKLQVCLQYIDKYLQLQQFLKKKFTSQFVTLIIWIGILYLDLGYIQRSLYNLKEALNLIKKYRLKNKTQQHMALETIGIIYLRQIQHDPAIRYFTLALKVHQNAFGTQNKVWINTKNLLGQSYFQIRNYQEAIRCYQDCLQQAKNMQKADSGYLYALSLLKIITVYQIQGTTQNKEKIDNCYRQILDISSQCETLQETLEKGCLLEYISQVHQLMNDYDLAEKCSTQALKIYKKSKESFVFMSQYTVLRQLGFIFFMLKQFEPAVEHYREALSLVRSKFGQDALIVADTRNQIAKVYYQHKKYDQAIDEYLKELQIRNKIEQKITFKSAKTKQVIAMAYERLGAASLTHEKQKYYSYALFYYEESLQMFESLRKILTEIVEQECSFIKSRIQVLKEFISELPNRPLFIQLSP